MKEILKSHIGLLSILGFYLILFIPFLGRVHLFDWDEINFAEAAREMLITGDWFNVKINYDPFWEKPPLFIWLQAISMKIFGVNAYAARFPNVLVGFATLIVLYKFVITRYGKQAAVFSLLVYLGSYTSHFYFKSGIIDPLFNLFIFLSIVGLVKYIESKNAKQMYWAGFYLGLAVLTKGPVALLIVGLTGLFYQLIYKVNFYHIKGLIVLLVGVLSIPVLYFGFQVYTNGWWFVQEFIAYQIDLFQNPVASHGQPFYYHFVVLLIGCFPMFGFAFGSMLRKKVVYGDTTAYRWMKILFWVVLILFSLVTTKIVHYSSMCYIPLAVVGGVWFSNFNAIGRWTKWAFGTVGAVWFFVLLACGLLYFYGTETLMGLGIKDDFVLAQLHTKVEWSAVPLLLAVLLLVQLLKALYKPTKQSIASFLVTNTLIVSLLMVSFVPRIEEMVQGKWINELKSYKGREMAHFTLGFKSYAHYFYTEHQDLPSVAKLKLRFLKQTGIESIYNLDQHAKKDFDFVVRNYVINETNIPITLSVKVQKFDEVKTLYPNLVQVFEGNGYGIWERAKELDK